jgi:hypothetical protein
VLRFFHNREAADIACGDIRPTHVRPLRFPLVYPQPILESSMSSKPSWSGVFPAVTTQFRADFSVDLDATHAVISGLVRDGVSGLVICGTVGENTSLSVE